MTVGAAARGTSTSGMPHAGTQGCKNGSRWNRRRMTHQCVGEKKKRNEAFRARWVERRRRGVLRGGRGGVVVVSDLPGSVCLPEQRSPKETAREETQRRRESERWWKVEMGKKKKTSLRWRRETGGSGGGGGTVRKPEALRELERGEKTAEWWRGGKS